MGHNICKVKVRSQSGSYIVRFQVLLVNLENGERVPQRSISCSMLLHSLSWKNFWYHFNCQKMVGNKLLIIITDYTPLVIIGPENSCPFHRRIFEILKKSNSPKGSGKMH